MKSFSGKVAAITGAGSGIGRALAMQLASEGCHLSLCDSDEAGLAETIEMIGKRDTLITTSQVDVSQKNQVESWAEASISEHSAVDILINNAGVGMSIPLADTSAEDMAWIMNLNFWGVVHGTQAFLPYLLQRPEAGLCNISSIYGLFTAPGSGAYCASKAAVRAYTQTLAQELSDTSVTVSCAYPGGIKTGLARNSRLHPSASPDDYADNERRFNENFARTSAKAAASKILKGMRRKQERILVGTDAHIFDRSARWFPGSWQRIVRKYTA